MNICHTWYWVKMGFGNVPSSAGGMSNVFAVRNRRPGR
ncbi:hypothetical protein SAMN04489835_3400 [Mycolicibacterium rutilum]|uniref:Uncharacterized protein n=1 Tax=Mycolicibacterium rutilum TaxID=370526 RepID=A0A1H6KMU8_MYCRU|nr:hypothetical protein SAMN04489835_3400 [Mycolicibacterium rutilum]